MDEASGRFTRATVCELSCRFSIFATVGCIDKSLSVFRSLQHIRPPSSVELHQFRKLIFNTELQPGSADNAFLIYWRDPATLPGKSSALKNRKLPVPSRTAIANLLTRPPKINEYAIFAGSAPYRAQNLYEWSIHIKGNLTEHSPGASARVFEPIKA